MNKKIKWLSYILCAVLLISCFIVVGFNYYLNNAVDRKIINNNSFFENKNVKYLGIVSDRDSVMNGCYSYADSDYHYYLNSNGFIEWIEPVDFATKQYPEIGSMEQDDILDSAEVLFIAVFGEKLSNNYTLRMQFCDFDGGSYLVTVDEMLSGRETGNKASIAFSGEGELMLATFVEGVSPSQSYQLNGELTEISRDQGFSIAPLLKMRL